MWRWHLSLTVATVLVSGCGGSGGSSNPGPAQYELRGTVAGLSGSGLVLITPGEPSLNVPAGSTSFAFASPLQSGAAYSVSVAQQPSTPWQTCVVDHGTGTVSKPGVTDVSVTCTTNRYSLSGTVTGLTATGLTLSTSGMRLLPLAQGAATFAFPETLPSGSTYDVYVAENPLGQVCDVTNAKGVVGGGDAKVSVSCRALSDWVSNCGDLAESGIPKAWTSRAWQPSGYLFSASVQAVGDSSPAAGRYVARAMTDSAFDFALVYSATTSIDASGFSTLRLRVRASNTNPNSWQGAFPVVVLKDSGGARLSYTPTTNLVADPGTQWISVSVPLAGGAGWVTGSALPEGDTSPVTGPISLASIVAIEVHFNTFDWNSYSVDVDDVVFETSPGSCPAGDLSGTTIGRYALGGTVDGLSGGLLLGTAGQNRLTVDAGAISFAFGAPMFVGTSYDVAVLTQPADQVCTISKASGIVGAGEVLDVGVSCLTRGQWGMIRPNGTGSGLRFTPVVPVDGGTAGARIGSRSSALVSGAALLAGGTTGAVGTRSSLLTSGLVLVAGGTSTDGTATASATLYDPVSNVERSLAPMNARRAFHTLTRLWNGTVLIAGGDSGMGSAEVFLPETQAFLPVPGGMMVPRSQHTATALPNGTVLIAGGINGSGVLRSAEIFEPVSGTFRSTGSMGEGRIGHTATLLANGQVLIVGGRSAATSSTASASAELYDAATGVFSPVPGFLNAPRSEHSATLLPNGSVLIAGGSSSQRELASAELFDPATATFATTPAAMAVARKNHSASLLATGEVLLAGGSQGSTPVGEAELYDWETGQFTPTGPLVVAQSGQSATLLLSSFVLLAGGVEGGGTPAVAELYFPPRKGPSGQFSQVGDMATPREGHTATLLRNGQVLVAGGGSTASAELFDVRSGAFTPTAGSMSVARTMASATLLPDGRVLVAGGCDGFTWLSTAEVYDPRTTTFTPTGSMSMARCGHSATLLPDGKVLLAGGQLGALSTTNTAEMYDPATGLFSLVSATMHQSRTSHTATALGDGTILLAGGSTQILETSLELGDADIYDPLSSRFISVGSMNSPRSNHSATLLPSGRVLLTGGATEELYDPAGQLFTSSGSSAAPTSAWETAVLLPDGTVLITGEADSPLAGFAALYNPIAKVFVPTSGSPIARRSGHTMTVLPNGQVLLAGGRSDFFTPLASAEIYTP